MEAFRINTIRKYEAIDIFPAVGLVTNSRRNSNSDPYLSDAGRKEKQSFIGYHVSASLLFYGLPAAAGLHYLIF